MFTRASWKTVLITCAAILAVMLSAHTPVALCSTDVEFIDVDELQAGMRGTARTVMYGTEPEEFDVEVLGVLAGAGNLSDLVLVRASGPAVKRSGGIAEGMSGSPVYIDGRLMGALAYVFPGGDHYVGMVTPIADMLRMLSYAEPGAAGLGLNASILNSGSDSDSDSGCGRAVAASSAVVSGISGRALDRLASSLKRYGLSVRPALTQAVTGQNRPIAPSGGASSSSGSGTGSGSGSGSGSESGAAIVPGSAIGVQLAQGDVNITVFGTVTYVDGDRILAFGHPVLGVGAVDLMASAASVHGVFNSAETPFKVMSAGLPVGRFTQDRTTGMAGRLGSYPETIPVSISVTDSETGRTKTVSARIVPDDSLVADVFGAVLLASLDGTTERVGRGTSTVDLRVETCGREPFERSNMFWSDKDVSGASSAEAVDIVSLLAANAAEPAGIRGISVAVRIEPERRTAMIEKAVAAPDTVLPGDTVDVEVTLRTYRGKRTTVVVPLSIPEDVPDGVMSICVRGGSELLYASELGDDGQSGEDLIYMDIADVLASLGDLDRGNELVVELEPYLPEEMIPEYTPSPATALRKEDPLDRAPKDDKEKDSKSKDAKDTKTGPQLDGDSTEFGSPVIVKTPTDYVVQGVKWITIEVAAPEGDNN